MLSLKTRENNEYPSTLRFEQTDLKGKQARQGKNQAGPAIRRTPDRFGQINDRTRWVPTSGVKDLLGLFTVFLGRLKQSLVFLAGGLAVLLHLLAGGFHIGPLFRPG